MWQARPRATAVDVFLIFDGAWDKLSLPLQELGPVELRPPLLHADAIREVGDMCRVDQATAGLLQQGQAVTLEGEVIGVLDEEPRCLGAVLPNKPLVWPASAGHDLPYPRRVSPVYGLHLCGRDMRIRPPTR